MSEPGAGSDVAAIGTKAVKKGDEVNKCFLLAFTIYVVFFILDLMSGTSNMYIHNSIQDTM